MEKVQLIIDTWLSVVTMQTPYWIRNVHSVQENPGFPPIEPIGVQQTQAAEVGGSYDAGLETMQHVLVEDGIPFYDTVLDADGAWREYNTENNHSDYGMPPDIYRYTKIIV